MILKKIWYTYRNIYLDIKRKSIMKAKRADLSNKDICLIASNCNGACILHELKLQFKSPFVNLWIYPADYLKMLKNLNHYMQCELIESAEEGIKYPVGMLDDIKIYFEHYKTFSEAKTKWDLRKSRMNYDNLYVMFSDRDGCTEKQMEEFDNLPFAHKVILVNRPHDNIKSAAYIKGFEENECIGHCMEFRGDMSAQKFYDDFDYVSWFNNKDK